MFCPNCGSQVNGNFCSNCGCNVNGGSTNCNNTTSSGSTAGNVLGTLVTVGLLSGLTQQLYYMNGMYYYDRFCRRPFPMSMIGIPHHRMHMRPMGMRPMPGPRGPMGGGHIGGPRGPMGGGHMGGPRGGGHGPGGHR